MLFRIIICYTIFNLTLNFCCVYADSSSEILKQTTLPPCRACKVFVESFQRGFKRTSKGKFEGGDAAWEEEKLGSYSTSEIRLTEIQEKLCSDVVEGKNQCYSLIEEYDPTVEEWWFKKQQSEPDLYKYLCIDTFQQCCPNLHYGENCTACPGYPDNVCSNNGKCKGSGTRKGNGQCACDSGYSGEKCDACADAYFVSYKDDTKILCSKCHIACSGSCTKAGPTGCTQCTTGWTMDKEKGCLDVNECAAGSKSPCGPSEFCVNNDGSFKCLACDRSCSGCTGDGPDMCIRCAERFELQNNICTDSSAESRKVYIFVTRYITYGGLCIATCIILKKNTLLAAFIGIAVAIYISVSEYILNTTPTPKTESLVNHFNSIVNSI